MSKNKFKGIIRQALITPKGHLKVKFVEHLGSGDDVKNRDVSAKTDGFVHKDLIDAFNVLRGHMSAIVGGLKKGKIDATYINTRECMRDPELSNYVVFGITLNETEEGETVKLHVRKNCVGGGNIEFVTPAIDLYGGSSYEFSGNLSDDISDCHIEISKYMDGKFDDGGQLQLYVDEHGGLTEDEEEEVL